MTSGSPPVCAVSMQERSGFRDVDERDKVVATVAVTIVATAAAARMFVTAMAAMTTAATMAATAKKGKCDFRA